MSTNRAIVRMTPEFLAERLRLAPGVRMIDCRRDFGGSIEFIFSGDHLPECSEGQRAVALTDPKDVEELIFG